MEREKIIAKWEKEIENGDLEITCNVNDLYDFARCLANHIGADDVTITHDDVIDWIKEGYWCDSDVDLDDYNEWLENSHYYEDVIHRNTEYEINEHFDNYEPYDIIDAVLGNDYSINDEYFRETIYGIESFNDYEIEDDFRDYAIENNIVEDYSDIFDNEDEIIEKVAELYAIENAEKLISDKSETVSKIKQAEELLNSYDTFYDCTVDEEEKRDYAVLRFNVDDTIDAIYLFPNKHTWDELQKYVNEVCKEYNDKELDWSYADYVTEKLTEKFGAVEISAQFWNLHY